MTTTHAVSPHVDFEGALRAFGFPSFRPGQREALETLFERRRLLLVAPTGGGKSLIYQLPATMLPGTTLVISPLISLMHDQVDALTARGVGATYLASTLSDDEASERLWRLRNGEYRIVYVAPERLPFPGFRDLVRSLGCPLIAIVEAHCISQWGHDFRPEYLQIRDFLALHPRAMLLACTATATPVVRDDILRQLGLPAGTPQIVRGFARPNLALRARSLTTSAETERAVDGALRDALGGPAASEGGAIVYCQTRKDAEEEARSTACMDYSLVRSSWPLVGHEQRHFVVQREVHTEVRREVAHHRLSIDIVEVTAKVLQAHIAEIWRLALVGEQ